MRALAIASAILIVGILVWWLTYPQSSDPKNMRYVLWKAGVYKMDLDQATGTMIGDRASERMVVGKTKGELRENLDTSLYPWTQHPILGVVTRIPLLEERRALYSQESVDGRI